MNAGRIWAGSLATIAGLIVLKYTVDLFLVDVACVLTVCVAVFWVQRNRARQQRDEARAERDHLDAEADALAAAVHNAAGDIARLEAECNAHAATNAALVAEAALTDSATGTTVRVPLLRVVPKPRTDSPPIADESWLDEITKPGGWS